ncbi:hypothetical protein RCL1_001391 [Eukaryota sp. TZLM3-RCL]
MLLLLVWLNYLVSTIDAMNQEVPADLNPPHNLVKLSTVSVMHLAALDPDADPDTYDFTPRTIFISQSDDVDIGPKEDHVIGCSSNTLLCHLPKENFQPSPFFHGILTPPIEIVPNVANHVYENWYEGLQSPVQVHVESLNPTSSPRLSIDIMFNHTARSSSRYISSMGIIGALGDFMSAFYRVVTNNHNVGISTSFRNFPHPAYKTSFDVRGMLSGFISAFVLHLPLALLVSPLVFEKENGLLDIMTQMGLKRMVYNSVNYTFNLIVYLIVCAVLIAAGIVLDFPFFTRTSLVWWVVVVLVWSQAVLALCQLFTTFFKRSKWCTFSMFFFSYMVCDLGHAFVSVFAPGVFNTHWITWFPSFALVKVISILESYTAVGQPGVFAGDVFSSEFLYRILLFRILVSTVVIYVLAYYLEVTLTNKFGHYHDFIFFLRPSFYSKFITKKQDITTETTPLLNGVEEVDKEAKRAFEEIHHPVRVLNLGHSYPGSVDPALKGISFVCKKGELVGVVGSNGAGKTTCISALCGLFKCSNGDALLNSYSVRSSLDDIYKVLGVCPQADSLWSVLSGQHHLEFYAKIKGYSNQEIEEVVNKALKTVNLEGAKDKDAGKYSGGMRRRLSLAISLLGSRNKIAFLDECTTGVDVGSCNEIWAAIKSQKADKTIILTSHSFEEINELADRVIIMNHGRIAAIGTPLELRSKYGDGWKISLVAKEGFVEVLKELVSKQLPSSMMLHQLSCNLEYVVPLNTAPLSSVFATLKMARDEGLVVDSNVDNASLAEVFEKVTAQ